MKTSYLIKPTISRDLYYVYFISDGSGHIKIGKTHNIPCRLKELQTGCPEKLKLLAYYEFESEKDAYKFEVNLHKEFKSDITYGEWFREYNILNYIRSEKGNIIPGPEMGLAMELNQIIDIYRKTQSVVVEQYWDYLDKYTDMLYSEISLNRKDF